MSSFYRTNFFSHFLLGIGYARSTEEELTYIASVSFQTGIVVDPVYSGKALHYFSKEENQCFNMNDKILFVHTGGILGMYEKISQLQGCLPVDRVQKMNVSFL